MPSSSPTAPANLHRPGHDGHDDGATIPFFTSFLLSFEYLALVHEVMGPYFTLTGKYIVFATTWTCRRSIPSRWATSPTACCPSTRPPFTTRPSTSSTWKIDLKKFDTAGKLDAVANARHQVLGQLHPAEPRKEGLKIMGPIRDLGANRPV